MKTNTLGSQIDDLGYRPQGRTIQVPFFPQRRVSLPTALWAVTIGLGPLLIHHLFAAGARKRAAEKARVENT